MNTFNETFCVCGHPRSRHVKGTSPKHYCIEQGCRCGEFISNIVITVEKPDE